MNKNDKFRGITPIDCENNVNELNENELDSVVGGTGNYWDETGEWAEAGTKCANCKSIFNVKIKDVVGFTKITQCSNCLTGYKVTRCVGGVSFELA